MGELGPAGGPQVTGAMRRCVGLLLLLLGCAADDVANEEVAASSASASSATASAIPSPTSLARTQEWPTEAATEDDPSSASRVAQERTSATGGARIASIARETWVYDAADVGSQRIGYLRAGATVVRKSGVVEARGCPGGFYAIEPRGFVCHGKSSTLDLDHPVVKALGGTAGRDGLPFDYVIARSPGPRFYTRLPTLDEQRDSEKDFVAFHKEQKKRKRDALPEAAAVPALLADGGSLPGLAGDTLRGGDLVLGHAKPRAGIAIVSQFEHEGRRFGLTSDVKLIDLDRTRWVTPSTFAGQRLTDEASLPIAFVMKKQASLRDESGHAQSELEYREALSLTGKKEGGAWETRDGSWVKATDVRVLPTMERVPTWAKEGKKWIDISILEQSLVAYEGETPVYATLVSTGADGLDDPKTTHSTVRGTFLIHTKHLTITMDGGQASESFELGEVPFVQYFSGGYALHAAYWHDDFGKPRSHGCINLSPRDAKWLFDWTSPDVPDGWHGALSLKEGTLVHVHP